MLLPPSRQHLEMKMIVKELNRKLNTDGKTVAEYEAGKLHLRIIDSYDNKRSFEDLIYVVACHRLAGQIGMRAENAS